jgi:septum site-determining protein MinC
MIHFENTAPVKLKGVGGGLWVTLDPSHSEDLLIAELDKLFEKLKHLTANASVVIDMGDIRGHEDLFSRIKFRLIEKFNVGRVTTSPQKSSAPTRRIRQRDLSKGWNHYRSNALMLKGRVRSGQKIETTRHVMIFGDVNPGAEIIAGGDIIVLGKLSGKVHAGNPENKDAIVFALAFEPTLVKIAAITATGSEEAAQTGSVFACIEDGAILVQDYMKTNPFRKMPWPEVV